MGNLMQDLQYAFRTLRKNPGFAAVAVLALALGIGPNTAIFTIYNAVFLRPLPVEDPASQVRIYRKDQKGERQNLLSLSALPAGVRSTHRRAGRIDSRRDEGRHDAHGAGHQEWPVPPQVRGQVADHDG